MSKYHVVRTEFKNRAALEEALAKVCHARGISFEQGHALTLYGYAGDARPETANFVIRRHCISASANDLGFCRETDGSYSAIISEFDSHGKGQRILNEVKQTYARIEIERLAKARGMRVVEEKAPGGAIRLKLYPGQAAATRGRREIRTGRTR